MSEWIMFRTGWCIFFAAFPLCAPAQVYRWVDEQGKVHYGDRPIAKEVRTVPVLREAKAAERVPTPGTTLADLKKTYGEPDRIQSTNTKSGESQIWTYRKSKLVAKSFTAKIVGGEVVEVLTDSLAEGSVRIVTPPVPSVGIAAGPRSEESNSAGAESSTAEARRQRCATLKENLQRMESAQRRGGSASTMDHLRDEKRSASARLSEEGCRYF
jgi:hypothetical protein